MLEKTEKEKREIKKRIETEKERKKKRINIIVWLSISLVIALIVFLFNRTLLMSFASFFAVAGSFFLYTQFKGKLKELENIKKMENSFPDFLQLMASNLRAGMTIDRAMLLSSRPEFAPLDKEIFSVGKDITTGKSTEAALLDMAKRIKSEKIEKTILLIISGIKSGGNLAILLEETSVSMREREFVEKRAASNVLMYVIFIFIAASVGAPILFSLSSLLVETLSNVLSGLPSVEMPSTMSLPFTLTKVSISIEFIKYFSLVFIIVTNVLAALVLGLVQKGEEREGIKYLIAMLIISITLFFVIRIALSGFIAGFFV